MGKTSKVCQVCPRRHTVDIPILEKRRPVYIGSVCSSNSNEQLLIAPSPSIQRDTLSDASNFSSNGSCGGSGSFRLTVLDLQYANEGFLSHATSTRSQSCRTLEAIVLIHEGPRNFACTADGDDQTQTAGRRNEIMRLRFHCLCLDGRASLACRLVHGGSSAKDGTGRLWFLLFFVVLERNRRGAPMELNG
ncbi:hypothetical protein GCK32_007472, partial [Trichostrongylus colubriformis]